MTPLPRIPWRGGHPVQVEPQLVRASTGESAQAGAWSKVLSIPGVPGCYPGRAGGPWLCKTLVLSLFHAVVVPSGFRTRVQPHR